VLRMNKKIFIGDTTLKILSVVFAIFLWFFVITEQNPVVNKEVTIPVRLINVDSLSKKDLIMLNSNENFSISLKLKGKKEILDTVNQNSLNAYADLSNYAVEGENTIPVIINGLPEGATVTSRSEHSIKIVLDKKVTVQKPINVNITGNPVGGMASLTPIVTPSEVLLTGAESIVEKVEIVKVDVDIAGVNASVEKQLPIRLLDADGKEVTGVKLDTQTAKVSVPIANTKRVPLQLILEGSVPEGFTVMDKYIKPKEILVTGEQQALDAISIIDSNPVDISTATESLNITVNLNLPQGIQLVNSNEVINAVVEIQKVLNHTMEISTIEYRNLNEKYLVNDNPSRNIKLTVRGPESIISEVENNIKLYVDLTDAKEGFGTYDIHVSKSPLIEILELTPQQIGLDIKNRE
jgi:YbbR domain-containing protein